MKEGKEKLEIEIDNLVMDSVLDKKQLTISTLKEKFNELNWITYIEDSGENAFNVITEKGCIYEITQDENGKYIVIEQGKDNGEPWPTIGLEQLPTQGTANEKVQIKVTATVQETKKTKKVEKIINKTTGEEKEYVAGGIIFEVSQNGTYEFEAVADNGKTRRAKITINVESGDIIKISAEPTTPRNTLKTEAQNGIETGPIKVSITFGNINLSNTDKYQYRIGKEGSWQTATGKNVELNVTENAIIVAKYYDGKNSIGAQNYSIQNVDNIAPDEFTPTVTPTTNSIKVTASTEDTASEGASSTTSGVAKWQYSINNGSSWQDSSEFTGLTTGSYTIKVKAIDKAGNERIEEVSTQTENLTGGTITITPDVTTPRNTVKTEAQNGVATGPITVTITYGSTNLTNADRYQYKIGSESWQTSSSSTISFPITENLTIATRYYDGKNAKDGNTYSIKNVDNEAPNSFSASATSDVNSITLSGTTTDAVSSGYAGDTTLTYKYSKDGSSWQTSNTITSLAQNTTYTGHIKAIDKAGNERIATTSVTTKKQAVTGITLSSTSKELYVGDTFTLTATVSPDDAYNKNITWSSSNTSVATVSNGVVTAKAAGSTTITVTAQDGSGKSASCSVTVKNKEPIITSTSTSSNIRTGNALSFTWEVLGKIAKAISNSSSVTSNTAELTVEYEGTAYTIGVGDYTRIDGNKVRILGFNHDDLTNKTAYGGSNTYAGISFEYVDFITTAAMNSSPTNSGGWKASEMYTTLNTIQYNNLPAEVKSIIKQVKKAYCATYNSATLSYSNDYLWLLSCAEIWNNGNGAVSGGKGYSKGEEGSQYKYYKNINATYSADNNYLKKPSLLAGTSSTGSVWWLRSPYYNFNNNFCIVNTYGYCINYYATNSFGVAPGFSI